MNYDRYPFEKEDFSEVKGRKKLLYFLRRLLFLLMVMGLTYEIGMALRHC